MKKIHFLGLILTGLALLCFSESQAQSTRRLVQLSGIILGQVDNNPDSAITLPGVHVYVPKAGRGTQTNAVGFFSMPVLVGDSVLFSFVGYQRQYYIIPDDAPEYLTVIIELSEDVTFLQTVNVLPFPTEEVFKEAVLALNIPADPNQVSEKYMNQVLLALMVKTTPMDGNLNARLYLDQWAASSSSKFSPVTNPLFNPFNWVKFFKSLKQNKKN